MLSHFPSFVVDVVSYTNGTYIYTLRVYGIMHTV